MKWLWAVSASSACCSIVAQAASFPSPEKLVRNIDSAARRDQLAPKGKIKIDRLVELLGPYYVAARDPYPLEKDRYRPNTQIVGVNRFPPWIDPEEDAPVVGGTPCILHGELTSEPNVSDGYTFGLGLQIKSEGVCRELTASLVTRLFGQPLSRETVYIPSPHSIGQQPPSGLTMWSYGWRNHDRYYTLTFTIADTSKRITYIDVSGGSPIPALLKLPLAPQRLQRLGNQRAK